SLQLEVARNRTDQLKWDRGPRLVRPQPIDGRNSVTDLHHVLAVAAEEVDEARHTDLLDATRLGERSLRLLASALSISSCTRLSVSRRGLTPRCFQPVQEERSTFAALRMSAMWTPAAWSSFSRASQYEEISNMPLRT